MKRFFCFLAMALVLIISGCGDTTIKSSSSPYVIENVNISKVFGKPEETFLSISLSNEKAQRCVVYQINPPPELLSFIKNVREGDKILLTFHNYTGGNQMRATGINKIVVISSGAVYGEL